MPVHRKQTYVFFVRSKFQPLPFITSTVNAVVFVCFVFAIVVFLLCTNNLQINNICKRFGKQPVLKKNHYKPISGRVYLSSASSLIAPRSLMYSSALAEWQYRGKCGTLMRLKYKTPIKPKINAVTIHYPFIQYFLIKNRSLHPKIKTHNFHNL